jgi:glycerate-2-kinase
MNTVRKHLSEILGGQFARLAYPATVLGLVFSDVPGDDLAMVSSGPTVLDKTTASDAAAILAKYDIVKSCSLAGCDLRETPKEKIFFRKVKNILIVSNKVAVAAMKRQAELLGYRVRIMSTALEGEARRVGERLARAARPGLALIAAGETTVSIKGSGIGGRNQELALGALTEVFDDGVVISCASDGNDNTTAAGGLADYAVREAAKRKRIDPKKYLKNNDSFYFLKKTDAQILTGKTGINVSDLMISLRRKI